MVPPSESFILVADLEPRSSDRKGLPFLEHDGRASLPTTIKRFANSKECVDLVLRSPSSRGIRSGGWITTSGFINIFVLNFSVSGGTSV
jgi:hypothetical protein